MSCAVYIADDDPGIALVAEVGHGPIQQHHRAVAEADQEEDVRGQPEQPCREAREAETVQVESL